MNIKDMVKDGKKVVFKRLIDGNLIYETECGFEFPVPVEDTGDGKFLSEDKAMFLMRYIRKEIEKIQNNEASVLRQVPTSLGENIVTFTFFRKNELYFVNKDNVEFPVPLTDKVNYTSTVSQKDVQKYLDSHLESIAQERANNKASQ